MRLKIITAPVLEPVSLSEARSQCRVDDTADDLYLNGLILAAREVVERESWRALLTQTLELSMDAWPRNGEIRLPLPPTQSVTSITWLDEAGATHVIPAEDYIVGLGGEPARIVPAPGKWWPSDVLYPVDGIRIRFVAGWTTANLVPAVLRQATSLLIGHFYENREAVTVAAGMSASELPIGVSDLIGLGSFREF